MVHQCKGGFEINQKWKFGFVLLITNIKRSFYTNVMGIYTDHQCNRSIHSNHQCKEGFTLTTNVRGTFTLATSVNEGIVHQAPM